ncbi:hypothetical protein [Pseudoduganella lutea]|uniref:Uncharacterized protein n=1 Tax=Pseudoduganella lutea TaxID=321985 RepID=A0A4P6L1J0_9BURK|nr:hypothetical protein [Pseudoduganella lutea]QBE64598.1 hypothetical protein EWM63_17695 [Pseudoduganella lutea]
MVISLQVDDSGGKRASDRQASIATSQACHDDCEQGATQRMRIVLLRVANPLHFRYEFRISFLKF